MYIGEKMQNAYKRTGKHVFHNIVLNVFLISKHDVRICLSIIGITIKVSCSLCPVVPFGHLFACLSYEKDSLLTSSYRFLSRFASNDFL